MARRLVSVMVPDEAGNRLGGSGTELRIYDDAALTTLTTLYGNSTSGTTVPNPLTPNTGKQTTLTVAVLTSDTTITVADVASFAVGNVIPLYDGTNTVYRAITVINAGTKVLTLDAAVGVAFAILGTFVGAGDMIGHVGFWIDDALDRYAQTKDVASSRVLPPISFPVRTPLYPISVQLNGTTLATEPILNFVTSGGSVSIADDPANTRILITITASDHSYLAGVL